MALAIGIGTVIPFKNRVWGRGAAPRYISYITLDQTVIDPATMISGDTLVGGGRGSRAIKWIRENSHRYLGKYTAAGTMTLCQLDDSDSTKFYDGTAATLDGTQGDVFVAHPTFWTKAEEVTADSGVWRIGFATYQPDDTWLEWSGDDIIGAYKAVATTAFDGTELNTANNNTGYLRSISGVNSLVSVSQLNFKAKATNRSANFSLVRWEHQNIMAFLFYAIYGNTNAQAICGAGTPVAKITGLTNALGMVDTNSINGNTTSINFFGLENWWGDLFEKVDNVIINNTTYIIDDRNSGATRTIEGAISPISSWVIPSRMVIGKYLDLIPYPTQMGGDVNHGYCDGVYMTSQDNRTIARSCSSNQLYGGVSCFAADTDPSYVGIGSTSRLSFRGACVKADSVADYLAATPIG